MYVEPGRIGPGVRTYLVHVSLPFPSGREEAAVEARDEATLERLLTHLRVVKRSTSFVTDRWFIEAIETTQPVTPAQVAAEMKESSDSGELLTEDMTSDELRALIEEWRRVEGT